MSTPVDTGSSLFLDITETPKKENRLSHFQVSRSSSPRPTGVIVSSASEQILNTDDSERGAVNFFISSSNQEEDADDTRRDVSSSSVRKESSASKNAIKGLTKFIKSPFKRTKSDTALHSERELQTSGNILTTISEDSDESFSKANANSDKRRYRKFSDGQTEKSKGISKLLPFKMIRSKSEVGFSGEVDDDLRNFPMQVKPKSRTQDDDIDDMSEDSETEVNGRVMHNYDEKSSKQEKEKELSAPRKISKTVTNFISAGLRKAKSTGALFSKDEPPSDKQGESMQASNSTENVNDEISDNENKNQQKRRESKGLTSLLNLSLSRAKSDLGLSRHGTDSFSNVSPKASTSHTFTEERANRSSPDTVPSDETNGQSQKTLLKSLSGVFNLKFTRSKSELGPFKRSTSTLDDKKRRKSDSSRRFAAQNAGYVNTENTIEIRESGGNVDDDEEDDDISDTQSQTAEVELNISVMYRTSFDFKRPLNFGECDIAAVCITSAGFVVVFDRHSNTIRLFDDKYHFISSCEAEGCTGLVKVNDKRIAVTCEKQILFCRIKARHLKWSSKTVEVGYRMYGLAYARGHYIIVCHWVQDTGRIHILTKLKGKVRSPWITINAVEEIAGDDISTDVCLAADSRKNLFYVTDPHKRYIAAVTFRGRVVYRTTFDWVPRGIAAYKQYLVVCNSTKRSFCLIDRRGIVEKTLTANLHENPGYVCCDKVKDKLIISSLRTKTLRVYDLLYVSINQYDITEC